MKDIRSIPDAFDSLRAEHEGAWLKDVFIPPDNFLAMTKTRSLVVFGGEGSGKTALRIALQQHMVDQKNIAVPLGVRWHPMPIEEGPRQIFQVFMKQMLDACAQELLYYSYKFPHRLRNSVPWVQEATAWFIQTFLLGDWNFQLERLTSQYQTPDTTDMQSLLSKNSRAILPTDSPSSRVIAHLASIAKGLGAGGVMVYVDGMEAWIDQDKEALVNTLKALLSTLVLFEDPGFAIKLMVPNQLESDLLSTGSTIRRRWEIYKLDWSNDQLLQILETRATALLGRELYTIANLYNPKELQDWLATYGGSSPRAWLELARPLIEYQQSKNRISHLSEKEFVTISQRYPPKLRIDLDTNKVFIGYGEITKLQPLAKKLLRYLYTQKNRVCTREELYFKARQGLIQIPQSDKDDHWVGRGQWEKSIDTALYRIRQAIEPDPQNPIYLVSDVGKSIVRLKNTW